MIERNHITPDGEQRHARFSDCEKYRYTLTIIWDKARPMVQFVALNPSTASELQDDPTLRRVKQFAKDWGYGGVVMTNIFAWRDTDPEGMKKVPRPIGETGDYPTVGGTIFSELNDFWLHEISLRCRRTIAAWGKDGKHLYRAAKVKQYLTGMHCLKLNSDGQPSHPLYLKGNLKPIPFN